MVVHDWIGLVGRSNGSIDGTSGVGGGKECVCVCMCLVSVT